MLVSIVLTVASLIVVHGLWERGERGQARDQALLFNAATAHGPDRRRLALPRPLAGALAEALVVTGEKFSEALGSDVGFGDYLSLPGS